MLPRHPPPAALRRRRVLFAVALLAAVVGLVVGARAGDPEPRPAQSASPQRTAAPPAPAPSGGPEPIPVVGRLILLRFVGTEAPAYVRRALREGRAGGAILFRDNVESPAQLRALTRALDRAAGGDALVAVDQEGGSVRVIPWAGPERSAPAQAAGGSAEEESRAAGQTLAAAGVDVVLGPVADLPAPGLPGRAFGPEPGAAVAAAVRGWRAGGVLPTAKHFPGLGGATANTDDAEATLPGDREPDLAAFQAAIGAGVPLVMASHARYPGLDASRIASQSRRILDGILRDRLGFEGVVITDSLEAAAPLATGPLEVAAERSLRAGADLLLTTGRGSYLRIHHHLVERLEASPALAARVAEATRRVEALRR